MPESKTIQRNGLEFAIDWAHDPDADLSHLTDESRYVGLSKKERSECEAQDIARLNAYENDEWQMLYCTVTAKINNANNWVVPHSVGRASLSGIESDSDETYCAEVEEELIGEAVEDAKLTLEALKAVFG